MRLYIISFQRRSHPTRGAWIEIEQDYNTQMMVLDCRTLPGVRGLK